MTEPTVEVDLRDVANRSVLQIQHGNLQIKLSLVNNDEDNSLKMSGRKCSFFRSKNGCKNGDECPNQHYRAEIDAGKEPVKGVVISENDPDNELCKQKQQHFDLPHKSQLCKFYKKGNCDKRDCLFSHEDNKKEHKNGIHEETKGDFPETEQYYTEDGVCKFFLSERGCIKSDCRFFHTSGEHAIDNNKDLFNNKEINSRETICHYFSSVGGCRRGSKCPNLHEFVDKEEISKADNNNKITEEPKKSYSPDEMKISDKGKICKFFITSTGCFEGENCPNKHVEVCKQEDCKGEIEKCHYLHVKVTEEICRFFHTKKGCRNGLNCPDLHKKAEEIFNDSKEYALKQTEVTVENTNKMSPDEKRINCKFFNTKKGCFKGEKCPNVHEKCITNPSSQERDNLQETNVIAENSGERSPGEKTAAEKSDSKSKEDNNGLQAATIVSSENSKEKEKKIPDEKKICRFINTHRGCIKGDNCPYIHVEKKSDVQHSTPFENKTEQKFDNEHPKQHHLRKCRFFFTEQGCTKGIQCSFSHETSGDTRPKQNDIVIKTSIELRETEIKQLEKRWKERFECLQNAPEAIYNVTISATDPDWVRIHFIFSFIQNVYIISFLIG